MIHQDDNHSCGTILLAHAASILGLTGTFDDAQIQQLREWLLGHFPFSAHSPGGPEASGLQGELAQILISKGVPANSAFERAGDAITALGSDKLAAAMTAKNPWQALKGVAMQGKKQFKFVLAWELQAHIEKRAKEKHGANLPRERKKEKHAIEIPAVPDPSQLQLHLNHFRDADGNSIPQIAFADVYNDARGIALCTKAEAMPFIQQAKSISALALALLIVEEVPTAERGVAKVGELRFPATYTATDDPVLIRGALLQLGDVSVVRAGPPDPMASSSLAPTMVIKLAIFRDELALDWSDFVKSPVKHLLTMVPALRLCRASPCPDGARCGFYHPPVDETPDQVLQEVWSRRFTLLAGSTCEAAQADLFTAFLRILADAATAVLRVNQTGIYFEPRDEATRSAHPGYAVVWIPQGDADRALHLLRTTPEAMALVRLKSRYGLRVQAKHEQTVHEALRPNAEFVQVRITQIYRLHPLPHGLQRATLAKFLKEIKWCARPLQPSRGSSEGASWNVGASSAPPTPSVHAFGRDILITLVKEHNSGPASTCLLAASRRTQRHIQAHATGAVKPDTDPWLATDPWSAYHAKIALPATKPDTKHIDEVAQKLQDSVRTEVLKEIQNMPAASGSTSSPIVDQRFSKLEAGLQEVRAQGDQFQKWFTQANQRMTQQEQASNALKSAIDSQQKELGVLRQDVQQTGIQVGTQLASLRNDLGSHLDDKIDSAMQRFEALLSKKQRTED